jgi:amino acid transporter
MLVHISTRIHSHSSHSDIPLVITAYLFWKILKKTRIVALKDIPLQEALDEIMLHPEEVEPESKGWKRFVTFLWD